MKLYLNNPNEEWIVDRLCQEWNQHNSIFSTNDPSKADLLWIISPWSASNISKKFLREKKLFVQSTILILINLILTKKENLKNWINMLIFIMLYQIKQKMI